MSLPDRERLRLNELCNHLVDGTLTPSDKEHLEKLLCASEEARRFYVRAMALSASLFEYARESQMEGSPNAIVIPISPRFRWWTIGSLAAAALLLFAFWLAPQRSTSEAELSSAGPELDDSIARISGANACVWTGSKLALGEELRRGQEIQLGSGLAEITFDSGAQVVLEGPGSLTLRSEWEAVLNRGTLKASVPPEALGFRVSNPSVEVVDLGTEFSMIADGRGATEVFVLKGSVEATAGSGATTKASPVVLREEEARRFASSGAGDVIDREQKLHKLRRKFALDRFAGPLHWVHWSFDEGDGTLAQARSQGANAPALALQFQGPPNFERAWRIPGHWRGALEFKGDVTAQAKLSGLNRSAGRTFAFWMKLPEAGELPESGTILASTFGDKALRKLQIVWNRRPAEGALGALRTTMGRGYVVGTTSLRDGQWHHIAVVLSRSPRLDTKIQIKQYVDGRLEGVSGRRGSKRRDDEAPAADDLLWIAGGPAPNDGNFRGDLDELFVADRALAPKEIKYLLQFNELPPENTLAGS